MRAEFSHCHNEQLLIPLSAVRSPLYSTTQRDLHKPESHSGRIPRLGAPLSQGVAPQRQGVNIAGSLQAISLQVIGAEMMALPNVSLSKVPPSRTSLEHGARTPAFLAFKVMSWVFASCGLISPDSSS